jgi:peptidoglycan/xylan/chitin deacetylase (PgdA/CDA1 family)
MAWLNNSKYSVISLDQAIEDLSKAEVAPYSTVITIDDGWYGTYLHMLPVLEAYSLPATLYVYTGAVDSQKALPHILLPALVHLTKKEKVNLSDPSTGSEFEYDISTDSAKTEIAEKLRDMVWSLDADQVGTFCRSLAEQLGFDCDKIRETRQFSFMDYAEISDANRRGLDIQLHTHSHRLNKNAPEEIATEILLNRKKLAQYVNSSLEHFCYPGGVHCPEMYSYLEKNGVKSAALVDTGLVKQKSNMYALNRILDGEHVSQLEFEAEMSGFMELIREARKIVYGLRNRIASRRW